MHDPRQRPWYAEWRVWFCLCIFALCGLAQLVFGLPFRVLDALKSLLF